jgi:hypothetical protein
MPRRLPAKRLHVAAFLDIEVAIVNGRLRVDLTCPVPEGESVARALVGLRDDPASQ